MWILKVKPDNEHDFYMDILGDLGVYNIVMFLSILRRETEGRLYHPSAWRRGTHDCGDAHEEHH